MIFAHPAGSPVKFAPDYFTLSTCILEHYDVFALERIDDFKIHEG
jgi:hypothetical protein